MLKPIHYKLLITFFGFLVIAIISVYIITFVEHQREYHSLQIQSKLIKAKYNTNYKNIKLMSNEFHLMYQNNTKLIDLLFEANNNDDENSLTEIRTKIYNLLYSGYNRLVKIGVSDIHFYRKNDKSLLRMSNPTQDTAEVLKLNQNIIRTNVDGPIQEGFKVYDSVSGITFTYPLFGIYNQYVGGVEITYSTKYLIDNISNEFTYDTHLLFNSKMINSSLPKSEQNILYEKAWESDGYVLDKSSHKTEKIVNLYHTIKSEEIKNKIEKNISLRKSFSLSVLHNYIDMFMTFVPLMTIDADKNNVYLVTYTQSDYLDEIILENKYLQVIFLSVLFLIFLFVSHIILSKDKFEQLALYDNVTQLANRTLFLIELNREIQRTSRNKSKIALLFIDLDGFKAVNDTYGHQIGDDLLQYVAKNFSLNVRSSDMVARVGGDEFIIILPNVKQNNKAVSIASNLINNISKPINIKDNEIKIGASIGISIYPDHTQDIDELIRIADNMMYESKKTGKNRVTLYGS